MEGKSEERGWEWKWKFKKENRLFFIFLKWQNFESSCHLWSNLMYNVFNVDVKFKISRATKGATTISWKRTFGQICVLQMLQLCGFEVLLFQLFLKILIRPFLTLLCKCLFSCYSNTDADTDIDNHFTFKHRLGSIPLVALRTPLPSVLRKTKTRI